MAISPLWLSSACSWEPFVASRPLWLCSADGQEPFVASSPSGYQALVAFECSCFKICFRIGIAYMLP